MSSGPWKGKTFDVVFLVDGEQAGQGFMEITPDMMDGGRMGRDWAEVLVSNVEDIAQTLED